MKFAQRSPEKELLDRDDIPFADIRLNMQELEFINAHLGGHQITCAGLRNILGAHPDNRELLVCEIGCGGGDNLLAIDRWCAKRQIQASFIGIDINPDCIEVASNRLAGLDVQLIASDYRLADLSARQPDIIFSSLFCHHFANESLVEMLQWMRSHSRMGYFINDLHRHPLAYHAIGLLSKLFSRSYLVKHDAPLSVLRGFTRLEWEDLFRRAGINNYIIQWKWAFRYLVTVTFTN